MTSERVIKETVDALINKPHIRESWMADPVLNLCASVGVERAAANRLVAHTPAWVEQLARYNALLDALRRIVSEQSAFEVSRWTRALLEVEHAKVWSSEAWTTAVVLAHMLLLMDHWEEWEEVKRDARS